MILHALKNPFLLFCSNLLQDMMGTLFLTKEMPEPPKQGFFKGLFGGGPSILDKEELCKLFLHEYIK